MLAKAFMNTLLTIIKRHRIISLSIFIFITLIILLWIFLSRDDSQVYVVKQEDLVNTVLVNGTYVTASQVKVNSPTNGIITELFVTDNQQVQMGDKLFHVQSSATESQKRTAFAAYLTAKNTLDTANATLLSLQATMFDKWDTFKELAEGSDYETSEGIPKYENRALPEFHIPQKEWLAAEANYNKQQAVIRQAQAALSAVKQTYDETQSITVTAPAAGTIINLAAKVKDQVSVPLQPNTGSPVLIIADFSNPSLISAVDQVNIPQLKLGQKASIIFDALPDRTLSGILTYIDASGTKSQGTTNFNVYITVNDLPPEIQLNMTASIAIETARKNMVLTVPNNAIIQKDGKTFLQLSNKKLTEVRLGLKGLTKTEVVSGLSAGSEVLEQL